MAVKRGMAARVYRNGGSYGSPTWTAINLVADVTLTEDWEKIDSSTRSYKNKDYVKGMLDVGITMKVRNDTTDAGFEALIEAHLTQDTVLDLLILDAAESVIGARGYRADFAVFSNSGPQELGGVIFNEFGLAPAGNNTNPPKQAEVTTGPAITYTSLAAA